MENLDPTIVSLARAIKKNETGTGDTYNSPTGADGEIGAYRFLPSTWKTWAGKHLKDSNAPITMDNQNKVAYSQIKEWKDQGYNPGQIASLWNSGKPDYVNQEHKGTSKGGAEYDTPAYVKRVYTDYTKFKGQPEVQPTSYAAVTSIDIPKPSASTETSQDQSIGQELSGRGQDIATGVKSLIGGKEATGQRRISGLLQTAGGIAGGLGDIVGGAIGLIPGVKAIENVIGKGAEKFAQTPTGQSIVKSMKEFSTEHPELSKDIGAAFNIATAIPVLRGLKVIGNVALDASSVALKKTAQNVLAKDLAQAASENPAVIKKLLEKDIIPNIEKGKWKTDKAVQDIANKLTAKELTYDESSNLLKTLSKIEGKEVKMGPIRGAVKNYAGTVGAGIGSSIGGLPGTIVGGMAGKSAEKVAEKGLGNISSGILKRSSKGAVRQPVKKVLKRSAGMIGGLSAQNMNR